MLKDWSNVIIPEEEEINERLEKARNKLVQQQILIMQKKLPVLVSFDGWGAAGKGSILGKIIKNIDPRFFKVAVMDKPTEDEKRRPFLYRYVINIPEAGKFTFMDGGCLDEVTKQKLSGKITDEEYKRKISEYLKNSGIEPEYYSMLGAYSDKENERQLEGFESENSDKTKFMIVMNKANEGLHIKGLDGMLWFRPLDENSQILYKQQIGRVITSIDPNNPPKDEDRPVVMDFANNTQRVNIDKEIKTNNRKNDLELLTIVVDWVKSHGGNLPQVTSTSNQERRYSATLYRIQQKYIKYRNGVEDGEITEEDRKNIEAIITKGEEIELWDRELEKISKEECDKILDVDSIEVKGNLHDLYELEKEVEDINLRKTALKNIIEIEEWCKEQFEGKPEYSRRTPSTKADDPREKTLGSALRHFKKKPIWINYQKGKKEGLSREKIKQKYELREEQIKLVERYERLIEEYDYWELNTSADNIMKIEKWCKEEFEGKPEYSRRTPNTTAKDPREKILGNALSRFKQNRIWTDYQKGKEEGLSRKEIKQKYELREGQIKLVERYERLIEGPATFLQ